MSWAVVWNRRIEQCEVWGGGSGVGPSSSVVGQARRIEDWAKARPIRPDERFVRYRTASIGSQVGPAVMSSRGALAGEASIAAYEGGLDGGRERWSALEQI